MSRPHSRRGQHGQALVEFALVFPVLLLLIFGIIDAGRLIYTYNTVANAARDGARVAIVNQSTTGTETCDTTSPTAWPIGCAIASGFNLGLTTDDVWVSYPTDAVCTKMSIGCLAVVTVTGKYQPLTPIISSLIGPVSLTSTTTIPIERVCASNC